VHTHRTGVLSYAASSGTAMADIRTLLRQTHDGIVPPAEVMQTLVGRRARLERRKRDSRRKIGSVAIGIAIVAAGVGVVLHEMARPSSNGTFADGDPIPAILPDARLAPGPHLLSLGALQITFDVPEDWRGSDQGVIHSEFGADGPNGAALAFWTVSNVYTDACNWRQSAARPSVGSTVNDLVRALATQKGHPSGDRVKANVAGFRATELEMRVPDSERFDQCDEGEFRTWQSPQGDRKQEDAGQVDQLFIVNVQGTRLVIDASFFPGTSLGDRSALFDMVRSIQFL
jgi:hypothetical protein